MKTGNWEGCRVKLQGKTANWNHLYMGKLRVRHRFWEGALREEQKLFGDTWYAGEQNLK